MSASDSSATGLICNKVRSPIVCSLRMQTWSLCSRVPPDVSAPRRLLLHAFSPLSSHLNVVSAEVHSGSHTSPASPSFSSSSVHKHSVHVIHLLFSSPLNLHTHLLNVIDLACFPAMYVFQFCQFSDVNLGVQQEI